MKYRDERRVGPEIMYLYLIDLLGLFADRSVRELLVFCRDFSGPFDEARSRAVNAARSPSIDGVLQRGDCSAPITVRPLLFLSAQRPIEECQTGTCVVACVHEVVLNYLVDWRVLVSRCECLQHGVRSADTGVTKSSALT